MKKILFMILAAFVVGFAFVSCSDDDDTNPKVGTNPERDAAGTYYGTYTKLAEGTSDTIVGSGSLVVTATENAYCATISFVSSELDFDVSAVSNITYANDGFKFWNANGDGTDNLSVFSGTIFGNGSAEAYFSALVYSGRTSTKYNFTFEGQKQ